VSLAGPDAGADRGPLDVCQHALAIALCCCWALPPLPRVAPLQMGVLQSAGEAGMTLASSLNIAAFNLGNALGAWLGGAVIAQGLGLTCWPGLPPCRQQRRCSWPARHVRPVPFRLRPWRRACTEAQTPLQGGTRHGNTRRQPALQQRRPIPLPRRPQGRLFACAAARHGFCTNLGPMGRHELFAGPHARFCTAVHQFRP
jgi:hypothetical protein